MYTLVNTVAVASATLNDAPHNNKWIFGAIAIVILVGALVALLGFAGGRDHS